MLSRRQKKNTCRRKKAACADQGGGGHPASNKMEVESPPGVDGGESTEERRGDASTGGVAVNPPSLVLKKGTEQSGSSGVEKKVDTNAKNQNEQAKITHSKESVVNKGKDGMPGGNEIDEKQAKINEKGQDLQAPGIKVSDGNEELAKNISPEENPTAPEMKSTENSAESKQNDDAVFLVPAAPCFRVSTIKSVGNVAPLPTFTNRDSSYVSAFTALTKGSAKAFPTTSTANNFQAFPPRTYSQVAHSGEHSIEKIPTGGGLITADMPTLANQNIPTIPGSNQNMDPPLAPPRKKKQNAGNKTMEKGSNSEGKIATEPITGSDGTTEPNAGSEKMDVQSSTDTLPNKEVQPDPDPVPDAISKEESRRPLIAFLNQYGNTNGRHLEVSQPAKGIYKCIPQRPSVIMQFRPTETNPSSDEANKASAGETAKNNSETQETPPEFIKQEPPRPFRRAKKMNMGERAQIFAQAIQSGAVVCPPIEGGLSNPPMNLETEPVKSNRNLTPEGPPDTTVVYVNVNPPMVDKSKSGGNVTPVRPDNTEEGDNSGDGAMGELKKRARPSSIKRKRIQAAKNKRAEAASCATSSEPKDDDSNSHSTTTPEEPISPPHTQLKFEEKGINMEDYAKDLQELQVGFQHANWAQEQYFKTVRAFVQGKNLWNEEEILSVFVHDNVKIPDITNYLEKKPPAIQKGLDNSEKNVQPKKNSKFISKNPKKSDGETDKIGPPEVKIEAVDKEGKAELMNTDSEKNSEEIKNEPQTISEMTTPMENDEESCGEPQKCTISSDETEATTHDAQKSLDIAKTGAQDGANVVSIDDQQHVEETSPKPEGDSSPMESSEINPPATDVNMEAEATEKGNDDPPEEDGEPAKKKKSKPSLKKRNKMKATMPKKKKKKGGNNPEILSEETGKIETTSADSNCISTGQQTVSSSTTNQNTSPGTGSTETTQPTGYISNETCEEIKSNENVTATETTDGLEHNPNEIKQPEMTATDETKNDPDATKEVQNSDPKEGNDSSDESIGNKSSDKPPETPHSETIDESAPAPDEIKEPEITSIDEIKEPKITATDETKNINVTKELKNPHPKKDDDDDEPIGIKSNTATTGIEIPSNGGSAQAPNENIEPTKQNDSVETKMGTDATSKKRKKRKSKPKNDEVTPNEIKQGDNPTSGDLQLESNSKSGSVPESVDSEAPPRPFPWHEFDPPESVIKSISRVNGVDSIPNDGKDTNGSNPINDVEPVPKNGESDENDSIPSTAKDLETPNEDSGTMGKKKKISAKKRRKQKKAEKASVPAPSGQMGNAYFTPIKRPDPVQIDCNENGKKPTAIVQPIPRRRPSQADRRVKTRDKRRPSQSVEVANLPKPRVSNAPRMEISRLPCPSRYTDDLLVQLHPYYTCYIGTGLWDSPLPLEPKQTMLRDIGIVFPPAIRFTSDEIALRAGEDAIFKHFDADQDGFLGILDFSKLCMALFVNGYSDVHFLDFIHVLIMFSIFDLDSSGKIDKSEFNICYTKWIHRVLYPKAAVIVVNIQNDFLLPTGPPSITHGLSQEGCARFLEPIISLINDVEFKREFYVKDWHPPHHISFTRRDRNGRNYNDRKTKIKAEREAEFFAEMEEDNVPLLAPRLLPRHCVRDTVGADLHQLLKTRLAPKEEYIVKGGMSPSFPSYSAFRDVNSANVTGTLFNLQKDEITEVYICGSTMDGNTGHTALDALHYGFPSILVQDCVIGKDVAKMDKMRRLFWRHHGLFATSEDVRNMVIGVKRRPEVGFKMAVNMYNTVLRAFKENVIYDTGDHREPGMDCPPLFKAPKLDPELKDVSPLPEFG